MGQMKRGWFLLWMFGVALFLAGGEETGEQVQIMNATLSDVFRMLSKKAGINLVINEEIDKKVTIEFSGPQDPMKLLQALADSYGYELVRYPEFYRLQKKTTAAKETVKIIRRTFQLNRVAVEQAQKEIAPLLSPQGKHEIRKDTNGLYVEDSEERIQRVEEYVKFLNLSPEDSQFFTTQKVFQVVRMDTKKLQETLPKMLSKQGRFVFDPDQRFLMVEDFPPVLNKITEFLQLADKEEPQIYIQCHFVEVSLNSKGEMGAGFAHSGKPGNTTISHGYNLLPAGISADAKNFDNLFDLKSPADLLTLNYSKSGDTFSAALSALVRRSNVRLLSSPNLLCRNNIKAKIEITNKVPYIQSLSSTQSGQTVTTQQQTQFEEVGILLDVTPEIFQDHHIKLKLTPEVSEVVEFSQNAPVVKRKRVDSTVVVKSGQTIVIGGLMEDHVRKVRSKIPFLGDIPLLGLLFSSEQEDVVKTELLIFLHIVLVDDNALGQAKDHAWKHQQNRHQEFDVEFEFFPHLSEDMDIDDVHPLLRQGKEWQFEFTPHHTEEKIPVANTAPPRK